MFVDFVYVRFTGPAVGVVLVRVAGELSARHLLDLFASCSASRSWIAITATCRATSQDSWRVNNRLTLNYGVRYDIESLSEYEGLSYGTDHNNIGPRFAMSYDLIGERQDAAQGQQRPLLRPHLPEPDHADVLPGQDRAAAGARACGTSARPARRSSRTRCRTRRRRRVPAGVRDVYLTPTDMQVPIVLSDHRHARPRVRERAARPASACSTRSRGTRNCCSTPT